MSKAKLNQPKLNKVIKKEEDLWITEKGEDLYIISGAYVVKTQEDIKGGLLTTLTKTFGRLPDDGEVLNVGVRELDINKALELYESVKNNKGNVKLVDTGLLNECIDWDNNFMLKILVNTKNNTYVNVDNEKIFIDNPDSFQGDEPLKPIYIEGEKSDMMLFPMLCDTNSFLKAL